MKIDSSVATRAGRRYGAADAGAAALRVVGMLAFAAAIAGCGQKGPLKRPPADPAPSAAAGSATAGSAASTAAPYPR